MLDVMLTEGLPDRVVAAPLQGTAVEPEPPARWRKLKWWSRLDARARREIIIGLALLFCYGFFRQVPAWNEYSRYDLVRALVEDNSTRIDRFADNTGDKAYFDGHYYSDKAPGTALIGVPVYRLLALSYRVFGAGAPDPQTAVEALAFVESGIPTVLLVLLLLRFLRPFVGEVGATVVGIGYGLGSIAFPFATMFFGHAASTFFLFAAFYILWRSREVKRPGWHHALAGFLAGWAALIDLTTLIGVALLLIYALGPVRLTQRRLKGLRWRAPGLMVAGVMLPAAVLVAYNWASFGAPFSLGYTNLPAGGFAQGMSQGILGVTLPRIDVLGDLLFGPRGLVRLAPWFIVSPVGLLAARRRGLRAEVLLSGAIVAAFLAFNAGYYLPFGGWTPGPRFLLPALPFAAILVALAPRWCRPLASLMIVGAVAFFFVATSTMPNAPEMYSDPLTQLWLPRILTGDLADTIAWQRWGLHGIEPFAILILVVALAAAAVLATSWTRTATSRLSGLAAGGLVVMIAAFAIPFVPPTVLASGVTSAQTAPMVRIVEIGATRDVPDSGERLTLWAQVENRGPALGGTRVVFAVLARDGSETWSAWYDSVPWAEGERKRLEVQWDSHGARADAYGIRVTVASTDPTAIYATADDAGLIRIGP